MNWTYLRTGTDGGPFNDLSGAVKEGDFLTR